MLLLVPLILFFFRCPRIIISHSFPYRWETNTCTNQTTGYRIAGSCHRGKNRNRVMSTFFCILGVISFKKKKELRWPGFFLVQLVNWSERNRRLLYFIFCLANFGTLTLCILHFTIFWGKEVDVWKIRRIFSLIHDDWYVCRPALKVSVKLCLLLQRLTLSCQSL